MIFPSTPLLQPAPFFRWTGISRWQFFIIIIITVFLIPSTYSKVEAQNQAIEQLLLILESKNIVSKEEVNSIRKTLAEDQARLEKRKQEIDLREKALDEREAVLNNLESELKTVTSKPLPTKNIPFPASCHAQKSDGNSIKTQKDITAPNPSSTAEPIAIHPWLNDGLCFQADTDDPWSFCIGGLLQSDYRYLIYEHEDPDKNRFDLRRVRLAIGGKLTKLFDYKFEYEFEGAGARNLLDAYVDIHLFPWMSLRLGQFKEPFGLEHLTKDNRLTVAERSMGYYLTPQRDVGVMLHGGVAEDQINYAVGSFNGDGRDDASGGNVDAVQFCGRLALAPFRKNGLDILQNFHLGGSIAYSRIDRNNVDIHVRTTGMTQFFDVASRAKFNIIQDAKDLTRQGIDIGWAFGPFALMWEMVDVKYAGVETSKDQFKIRIEDCWLSGIWMLTGEHPRFENGVMAPIVPCTSFGKNGWGALGLSFRYDTFNANEDVYRNLIYPGNSVRKASAVTYAFNWFLNPYGTLILDSTLTQFDIPLIVGRDSISGLALYSDREQVFTGRFQFRF